MKKIAIIGAGAAGMTAAIAACDAGADVILLEKSDRVGRKILATGNGRCNITNRKLRAAAFHGSCKSLLSPVFSRFGLQETVDFFENMGVPFRDEEDKCYPYNLQASSVQDALRYEIAYRGIDVRLSTPVNSIKPVKNGFLLKLPGETLRVDRVILTTGGKSSPQLGSNGEGFSIAKELGMTVTPLMPSLVRLQCDNPYAKRLSGIKVLGDASIGTGDTWHRTESGEILFTDEGVSGPPILQLSRVAAVARAKGLKPIVRINQFPDMDRKALESMLMKLCKTVGYKEVLEVFNGLLHKKIIPVMLLECGIDKSRPASNLRYPEVKKLAAFLQDWQLPVTGDAGFKNSQVTAGGIHRKEVSDTLESIKYPGFFLAGEVLDLDGDCGGFNLQWAWSSGYVAGQEAAQE